MPLLIIFGKNLVTEQHGRELKICGMLICRIIPRYQRILVRIIDYFQTKNENKRSADVKISTSFLVFIFSLPISGSIFSSVFLTFYLHVIAVTTTTKIIIG